MNAFYRLFQRLRILLLFLLLEAIAISLLSNSTYFQHSKILNAVRIQKSRIDARVDAWSYYFSLREANDQLAQENNELRNQLARYKSVDTLTWQIRRDTVETPLYTYIPAVAITNSVSDLHNYITLNIGAAKGVEPLMGVITHNGLVGTVVSVSEHYSLVMSLLNTDFRASVKLANSGAFGSLRWTVKNNYREVVLNEIPQHIPVNVGDTIVSSGRSEMFPSDVPVGIVKDYIKRGNFYEITVTLLADFKRLRYVEVVNNKYRNELRELESNRKP